MFRPRSGARDRTEPPSLWLLQSLLATGLTEPADVLQHCLALFRKADLGALQQYLPGSFAEPGHATAAAAAPDTVRGTGGSSSGDAGRNDGSSPGGSPSSSRAAVGGPVPPPVPRGPWLALPESGPLAALAGVLDVGARRVLPGHLLRRSQVLSTLRPAPGLFQQRVSLTACTGETSVFDWQLAWHAEGGQGNNAGGSSSSQESGSGGSTGRGSDSEPDAGARGRWVVESVRRDPSCDQPLPTTPHPK